MAASDDANETGPLVEHDAPAGGRDAVSAVTRPVMSDDGAVRGPDGWVRVLLALAVGVLAGALIALLLPRDDGPRRVQPAGAGDVGATPDAAAKTADPGEAGTDGTGR